MATYIVGSSILAFLILNTIENVIHYNIGRHRDDRFAFENPSSYDWMQIIFTMVVFGILQGVVTLVFDVAWQRWAGDKKNKNPLRF